MAVSIESSANFDTSSDRYSLLSAVYAIDGRINRNFLLRTKSALATIASLADELRRAFPLHMERDISGVSRVSAYLHLLYHQCIVLATRPLLFCFLKIRFESPENCVEVLNTSRTVRNLIQMSMDSSQQIICILHSLQTEGLLGKNLRPGLPRCQNLGLV